MSGPDEVYEYVVRNGLGHVRYWARSLEEARESIAQEQAEPGTPPKRVILRRRKAGPWETVPSPDAAEPDKPFVCGVCGSPMRTADSHAEPDFAAMWAALEPPRSPLHQRILNLLRAVAKPTE